MPVTLSEVTEYLKVEYEDEDALLTTLLGSAEKLCADIVRAELTDSETEKVAVLYAVGYLYEHRENADHQVLIRTLRALLFGQRQEVF